MLKKKQRKTSVLVTMLIIGNLTFIGAAWANWPQQDKLLASDGFEYDQFGYSVSINGNYAIVGAWGDDDMGDDSGSAYIFAPNDFDPNNWDQEIKLTASDGDPCEYFGYSVSISDGYAIVGAVGDDANGIASGSAYIFKRQLTFIPPDKLVWVWQEQQKLTASDAAAYYNFGYSVYISGDYAIVGAIGTDVKGYYSGSAYIFKLDGTSWSEEKELCAFDAEPMEYFGKSVSINGDYAIVGAYKDDDNGEQSGSAYIFRRIGTNWTCEAKLTASDGDLYDWFGYSVSISGDYAIVGAYKDDDNGQDSGSAYVFKRDGTVWTEVAKLLALYGGNNDWFGSSVSISGDYAIVGAQHEGVAYAFNRYGSTWKQVFKFAASDGPGDWFGGSVSISDDYAIVGASSDNDNGYDSGSAYVFKVCPPVDFNGDCAVNFADFALFAQYWLQ